MKQLNEATKRILTIVLIVVFTAGGLFIGTKIGNKEAQTDGKTAKLTFEDIGELATHLVLISHLHRQSKFTLMMSKSKLDMILQKLHMM